MRPMTTRQACQQRKAWCILVLLALSFTTAALAETGPAYTQRPSHQGKATIVYVSMVLVDIDEVNSANQNFAANFYYELRWNDPSLAHSQPSPISRPLDTVWNPRVQLVNQQKAFETMSDTVEITPSGEVTYRQRVWGHFSQPLDLREFPMDTQRFTIQMVSAKYSPSEVQFIRDPKWTSGIAERFSLADWNILSWKVSQGLYRPMKKDRGNTSISMSIEARRKVDYYTMNLILPLMFIVAMSWTVFWLHPSESGTQFSVAVTSMLTLIAYRFAVNSQLPMISYMTRMDYFTFFATLLVFLTLIKVVITTTLAKHQQTGRAVAIDRWARVLFPTAFLLLTAGAFFL